MGSLLRITHDASEKIIQLLEATTLGTNGAQYQLLNTRERIKQIDHPVHLTLERKGTVLANLTFCQRDRQWYLRYFAFDKRFQGSGKPTKSKKNSLLKKEIKTHFERLIEEKKVDHFYAYIDPKNTRSVHLAQEFGFSKIGQIRTQSFSRYQPKQIYKLQHSTKLEEISEVLTQHFSYQNFFFTSQLKRNGYLYAENDSGEIIAIAQVNRAHWRIKRLPGKTGNLLKKAIPYLPLVNKLIRPDNHRFIAVDTVWMKNPSAQMLADFFESLLYHEKEKVLFWWHDTKNEYHQEFKKNVSWGLINTLLRRPKVDVVTYPKKPTDSNSHHYVSAIDMI